MISTNDARILLFSTRNLLLGPARASNYEFEDVIQQVDEADLHAPDQPNYTSVWSQRATGKLIRELPFLERFRPAGRYPVTGSYDLLFVCIQSPHDLYLLGPLSAWRERCRVAVCWIDELWAGDVPRRQGELELMAQFDHIILGSHGSVTPVADRISSQVWYMPAAVDTVRFCPWPDPAPRVIDVFNMGRRSAKTHDALLEASRERGWFYQYDTFTARDVADPRAHREHLADQIKRSRYFVTNKSKCNAREHTFGQEEVGFRYFEGSAAGAVLVGEIPRVDSFTSELGWQDSVIEIPYESCDLSALLELESQPERIQAIRRRNVQQTLRRHDWLYRWQRILELAGLPATSAMQDRAKRLEELAAMAETGVST